MEAGSLHAAALYILTSLYFFSKSCGGDYIQLHSMLTFPCLSVFASEIIVIIGCVCMGVDTGLTESSLFLFLIICFIILHALTCFSWIWDPSLCPQHLPWPVLFIFPISCLSFVKLVAQFFEKCLFRSCEACRSLEQGN